MLREWIILFSLIYIICLNANAEEILNDKEIVLPEVTVESEKIKTKYILEDSSVSTKFPEENKNIPQSITVFNEGLIEKIPTFNFTDIITNDSSVAPADLIFLPKIRGFNAEILRDGYTSTRGFPLGIFYSELSNIERIEILKGPASVLYGNIASGGAINLVKKKPLPYDYLSFEGSVGDEQLYSAALDYNKTVNDDLQIRNIISYYSSESFRDFIEEQRLLINPSLSLNLTDKTRLDFDVEYYYTENSLDGGLVAVGNGVADIPFSRNLGDQSEQGDFHNLGVNLSLETKMSDEIKLVNRLHYNFNYWDIFNILPLNLEADNRTLNRSINKLDYESHIFSTQHEIYYSKSYNNIENKLVAGVDYTYEDVDNLSEANITVPIDIFDPVRLPLIEIPNGQLLLSERDVNNHSIGIFLQDFLNINDYLFILAGIRFDYTDYKLEKTEFNILSTTEKTTEDYYSPRLGVLFKPIENLGLFANFNKSFNQIIGYAISIDGTLFDAEKTEAYEAGVKFDLSRTVSSQLSFFKIKKDDFLVPDPFNGTLFAVAIDKAESKGVEAQLTLNPLDNLTMLFSYTYLDTEIIEDDLFPAGNSLGSVPDHTFNFWSNYSFDNGHLNGLSLSLRLLATSNREGDNFNSFETGDFFRLDSVIAYERSFKEKYNFDLSLNLINITDREDISFSSSRINVIPAQPLSFFIKLKFEYI